jgi:hypothetical protein
VRDDECVQFFDTVERVLNVSLGVAVEGRCPIKHQDRRREDRGDGDAPLFAAGEFAALADFGFIAVWRCADSTICARLAALIICFQRP